MKFFPILIVTAIASACSPPTPPAVSEPAPPANHFRTVATIKQIMKGIVEPASNAVFAAAGEAPKDDAGWQAAENNALALAESANLLMIEGRAIDQGEWLKEASALIDKSMLAVEAARAKDAAKLGEAGDVIYSACEDCHKLYLKAPTPP